MPSPTLLHLIPDHAQSATLWLTKLLAAATLLIEVNLGFGQQAINPAETSFLHELAL